MPGRSRAGTAVPPVIQEAMTARHVLRLDYRDRHDVVTVLDIPGALVRRPDLAG